MEDGVMTAVETTVVLIVVSFVLGILLVVAGVTYTFQDEVQVNINSVQLDLVEGEIAALNGYDKKIPVAAIYAFLEKYDDYIFEVRTVDSLVFDASGNLVTTFNANGTMITPVVASVPDMLGVSRSINNTISPMSRNVDLLFGCKYKLYIHFSRETQQYYALISRN